MQKLYDNSPLGLCFQDEQLRMIHINQVLADINGLPIEANLGKTPSEIIPDFGEQIEKFQRQVIETGQVLSNIEFQGNTLAHPDRIHDWIASYYPINLMNGKRGVGGVVTDITALKTAQEALRKSEKLFIMTLANSSITVFT